MTDLPEEEDSPDLTDSQIAMAVVTADPLDYAQKMAEVVQNLDPGIRPRHSLRRRKPHMYSLTTIEMPDGTAKVFVFRVDWVKGAV